MDRKLDGIYFRVMREGKWQNICFSDLTEQEREIIANMGGGRTVEWWKSVAYHLADRLKIIGDTFDIVNGEEEDE